MNGTASTPEGTKGIPMRRVVVKDPSHMPSNYSETPGGTMFSTTPGGIKQFYLRKINVFTLYFCLKILLAFLEHLSRRAFVYEMAC